MSDRGDIGKSDIDYTKQIIVHEKYIKFKQIKRRNVWKVQTLTKSWNCFSYLHVFVFFFIIVFNDGSQKELVNLDGTIPVNYRGNIYRKLSVNNKSTIIVEKF